MVLREQVSVNAWLVIEAVQVGAGGEREQVAIAGFVLGEQGEVIVLVVNFRLAQVHPTRRDVGFAADDRLNAGLLRRGVEVNDTVQCAMIGERERRHTQLARALDQRVDAGKAVEDGVFGVDVEVDEFRGHCVAPFRV